MTLKNKRQTRQRERPGTGDDRDAQSEDDTGDSIDSDKDTTRLDIICTEICTMTHD